MLCGALPRYTLEIREAEPNQKHQKKKRKEAKGVSHCGQLAIYIEKLSQGKRRIMKTQTISPCKNIIFKKSSKRN
jgi:hypothetical protein